MGLIAISRRIGRSVRVVILARLVACTLLVLLYAAGRVGQDVELAVWPGVSIFGLWTLVWIGYVIRGPERSVEGILTAGAFVDAAALVLLVDPLLHFGDPVYALFIAETVAFAILLKRRRAWLLGAVMTLAYLVGHALSAEVLPPAQYVALVIKVAVLTGASIAASYVVAHQEESRAEALLRREQVEELNARLQQLSNTDELTGLANYRALQQRLDEEIARAERHRTPLSVLMLDLDDFKRINDTYGHQVGDVVLAEVAAIFRGTVRAMDFVARYGGEEFTVALPETDLYGAHVVAEKLRDAVAGHRFPDHDGKRDIRLTTSIGVGTFPDHAITKEALLSVADDAVYNAKETGKNRVSVPHPVTLQAVLDLGTGDGPAEDGEAPRSKELVS